MPGPRFPLLHPRPPVDELDPYVPIGDNVRIGIAVFSDLDNASRSGSPPTTARPRSDLALPTAGISGGLADLLARVRPRRTGAR